MELAEVLSFITLMSVLSVAVERSNEIIINGFDLDSKIVNDKTRRFIYHAMGVVTGALIYFFNNDYHFTFLARYFNEYLAAIVAGLIVSGGSGVWHEALKFVTSLSSSKKTVL